MRRRCEGGKAWFGDAVKNGWRSLAEEEAHSLREALDGAGSQPAHPSLACNTRNHTGGSPPPSPSIKLHRFMARSRSHFSWQKQGRVAAQALTGSPQIYVGVTERCLALGMAGHLGEWRQDLHARPLSSVAALQQPTKPGFTLVVSGSPSAGPTASSIQSLRAAGVTEPRARCRERLAAPVHAQLHTDEYPKGVTSGRHLAPWNYSNLYRVGTQWSLRHTPLCECRVSNSSEHPFRFRVEILM